MKLLVLVLGIVALATTLALLVIMMVMQKKMLDQIGRIQEMIAGMDKTALIPPASHPEKGEPKGDEKGSQSEQPASKPAKEREGKRKGKKEMVLEAILKRKKEVGAEDLPRVEGELMAFFKKNQNEDYASRLESESYFRRVDISKDPDARVVVLGDIHCDYLSLAAALLKLSVSDYDYFEKAYFVFLGDYLDRGTALFEPLLLLADLKEILGDRMIMLKGNHETINFDAVTKAVKSRVLPDQTAQCLNDYCGENVSFLQSFVRFFRTLPIYVYLKTLNKTVLLAHAAIPRDIQVDRFLLDQETGKIVFNSTTPPVDRLNIRNAIFQDMIWGDPREVEEKIQIEGRFEFGAKQFDRFVSRNHIDLMIRSHEEVTYGFKAFFKNRLYTLFSTGGMGNQQTCYTSVEPALAVVNNKNFFFENSYVYQSVDGIKKQYVNIFSKIEYTEKQVANYQLNDEFICQKEKRKDIVGVMEIILSGFA